MKKYDYIIVGSGLFGSTFAYKAAQSGKRCLVIEKRSELGGNLYCENVEGINVHKFGPHIFHTSNKVVWDFVNSIVPFNQYINTPIANYHGKLYNLPFNMNTFHQMWGVITPEEAKAKIEEQRSEALEKLRADGATEPRNLEEQALILVGQDIYEKLIKGYTEKQWGRKCTELPAFIIRRLPVRFIYDNNYFNDCYQGIPIGGYNRLIEGLLAGSDAQTNTDFFDINNEVNCGNWREFADKLVYTGELDRYFGYRLGQLQYRTVRFEQETLQTNNFQGVAIVNYTATDTPFTRCIEHKHFECFGKAVEDNHKTVVSREFSIEWENGMEPYYPINDDRNNALAEKYRALAENEQDVIFGGRLAEYKYYDMAPIIEKILNLSI